MSLLTEELGSRTDVTVSDETLNILIHVEPSIGVTDKFIGF